MQSLVAFVSSRNTNGNTFGRSCIFYCIRYTYLEPISCKLFKIPHFIIRTVKDRKHKLRTTERTKRALNTEPFNNIIRAVNTKDAMTATIEHIDWAILGKITDRILKEVPNVNRVCYDLSPKPSATIEWE